MKMIQAKISLVGVHSAMAALCLLAFVAATPVYAGESGAVEPVLDRAARLVESFLGQFSDVKCTERVLQTKLGKSGKVEYKQETVFDFLLMIQDLGGELSLEESRLAEKESKPVRNLPLLVSNGFSTLLLVFHPSYQSGFEYARMEDEIIEGRRWARVQFRHIRGRRSPAALLLRGREYPLDLEGTAWVDPETGEILKINAGLATSMEDLGLRRFSSEVLYGPMTFSASTHPYWLPLAATIEVETPRQHWQNVHRFTNYQLFSVSATDTVAQKP